MDTISNDNWATAKHQADSTFLAFDSEFVAMTLGNRTAEEQVAAWAELLCAGHDVVMEEWWAAGITDVNETFEWLSNGIDNPFVAEHYVAEGLDPSAAGELFRDGRMSEELASVPDHEDGDVVLDVGLALLQPVSVRELAGIEVILQQLWTAMDSENLSEVQQGQILAMAELIKMQQVISRPNETERWKLLGPVRSALTYLLRELPKETLAWWKLLDLLREINWSQIAEELERVV